MEVTVETGSPAAIVAASWRDLTALRRLEQVCFPKDAWPLWDLVGILTFPNVVRLKAMLDGDMVGFIAADIRPPEGIAWIATIGVLPEQRERGIGSALLEACEAQLDVERRGGIRPSGSNCACARATRGLSGCTNALGTAKLTSGRLITRTVKTVW